MNSESPFHIMGEFEVAHASQLTPVQQEQTVKLLNTLTPVEPHPERLVLLHEGQPLAAVEYSGNRIHRLVVKRKMEKTIIDRFRRAFPNQRPAGELLVHLVALTNTTRWITHLSPEGRPALLDFSRKNPVQFQDYETTKNWALWKSDEAKEVQIDLSGLANSPLTAQPIWKARGKN